MKRLSDYETFVYDMDKGFMMDIVQTDEEREAWIYRKENGTKMFMFGRNMDDDTYEEFFDAAIENYETYADIYMHDYV